MQTLELNYQSGLPFQAFDLIIRTVGRVDPIENVPTGADNLRITLRFMGLLSPIG